MERRNMTMLTDFYEITMANGYFEQGVGEEIAYFDLFFRQIPDGGGIAIAAGLEQVIEYLQNLKFTDEDIDYLRGKKMFHEDFLEYLRKFKFTCDVWAIPEGTPVFPGEPLITVRGPIIQAQYIETMLLLIVNHQSLIATKANRIVRAAQGRGVMEFGSRRAHGTAAAIIGARAAYVGSVRNAFTETRDALAGNRISRKALAASTERVKELTRSNEIMEKQYDAGLSSVMDLLDVRRQLLAARQEQAEARRRQLAAVVGLCKALGGGWTEAKGFE